MKVQKISRKWIKPHTPTPPNLNNYKISFLDELQRPINNGVVLFYQSRPKNDHNHQLEESLAKTLVQFYPLAGRYMKNNYVVECNDQGAEFTRAEALEVDLLDLVSKTDEAEQLHPLYPDQYLRTGEEPDAPLLSIQATHFPCGGLSIAVSVSHRVFDAGSLATFVAAWLDLKSGGVVVPSFDLPSLLPCNEPENSINPKKENIESVDNSKVLKRFVFDKAAVADMKLRAGLKVSGVRVACAVIAKAMIGTDRAKHGEYRQFHIVQPVNMRERTVPPQPKHACGNFSLPSLTTRVAASEAEGVGLRDLVDLMGIAVRKCIEDHAEILSPDRDGRDIITTAWGNFKSAFKNLETTNLITFSDWSKFGLYEADFGCGKPVWVGFGLQKAIRSNCSVMMSDKEGDGFEAWVHLNGDDMRCFEQDDWIKRYTIALPGTTN